MRAKSGVTAVLMVGGEPERVGWPVDLAESLQHYGHLANEYNSQNNDNGVNHAVTELHAKKGFWFLAAAAATSTVGAIVVIIIIEAHS